MIGRICVFVRESARIGRWNDWTHAWNGWIDGPAVPNLICPWNAIPMDYG